MTWEFYEKKIEKKLTFFVLVQYGCAATAMECLPLLMSLPVPISDKEVK